MRDVYETIDGSVTAPRGFRAAGVACGIKANKAAGPRGDRVRRAGVGGRRVHDQPRAGGAGPGVARAPRRVGGRIARDRRQQRLRERVHRAPTACEHARAMAGAHRARRSALDAAAVLVASTGVIGVKLPMDERHGAASATRSDALSRRRRTVRPRAPS